MQLRLPVLMQLMRLETKGRVGELRGGRNSAAPFLYKS
jgi:hypothetical protein